jgi:hypothetical protein
VAALLRQRAAEPPSSRQLGTISVLVTRRRGEKKRERKEEKRRERREERREKKRKKKKRRGGEERRRRRRGSFVCSVNDARGYTPFVIRLTRGVAPLRRKARGARKKVSTSRASAWCSCPPASRAGCGDSHPTIVSPVCQVCARSSHRWSWRRPTLTLTLEGPILRSSRALAATRGLALLMGDGPNICAPPPPPRMHSRARCPNNDFENPIDHNHPRCPSPQLSTATP